MNFTCVGDHNTRSCGLSDKSVFVSQLNVYVCCVYVVKGLSFGRPILIHWEYYCVFIMYLVYPK